MDHELKELLKILLVKLDRIEDRLKAVENVAHKQVTTPIWNLSDWSCRDGRWHVDVKPAQTVPMQARC